MILSCIKNRIRASGLWSPLKQSSRPSFPKSLLHTTQPIFSDESTSKPTKDGPADGEKSTATERKRQLFKDKFAKMNFIALSESVSAPKPPQVKLKPDLDYQQLVKNTKKYPSEAQKTSQIGKEEFSPVMKSPKLEPISFKESSNQVHVQDREVDKASEEKLIKRLVEPGKDADLKTEKAPKNEMNLVSELRNLINKLKAEESIEDKETATDSITELKLTEKDFKAEAEKKVYRGSPYYTFHDLKSGNGLSIFTNQKSQMTNGTQESPIWSMHKEELKSAQNIPHLNGFDEMVRLTDEGKLWRFPIDNQQDMNEQEDAQTPFHEHIFLEHHLESFPNIEPIQQFMTLAINGLSQNGFISLKEKVEIINWYRDYFTQRLELINDALQAEEKERQFKESLRKGSS